MNQSRKEHSYCRNCGSSKVDSETGLCEQCLHFKKVEEEMRDVCRRKQNKSIKRKAKRKNIMKGKNG